MGLGLPGVASATADKESSKFFSEYGVYFRRCRSASVPLTQISRHYFRVRVNTYSTRRIYLPLRACKPQVWGRRAIAMRASAARRGVSMLGRRMNADRGLVARTTLCGFITAGAAFYRGLSGHEVGKRCGFIRDWIPLAVSREMGLNLG